MAVQRSCFETVRQMLKGIGYKPLITDRLNDNEHYLAYEGFLIFTFEDDFSINLIFWVNYPPEKSAEITLFLTTIEDLTISIDDPCYITDEKIVLRGKDAYRYHFEKLKEKILEAHHHETMLKKVLMECDGFRC